MSKKELSLSGEVYYDHRVSVPETALLRVQLLDISIPDLPPKIIDEQREEVGNRGAPLPFHLTYDPEQIEPNRLYTVQGAILVENRYWFINLTVRLVKLDGSEPQPMRIELEQVQ